MTGPRVAFLSAHLSGTGHLVRTLALARAVAAAGGRPAVISGGRPLAHVAAEGIGIVQLPPLMVRGQDFARLLAPEGGEADESYLAARSAALTEAIEAFRPEVLVTELFPLGRRRLAPEFLAAIGAARAAVSDCTVLASVRDVPEPPSSPAKLATAAERLKKDYDALLAHGDPAVLPLDASWPLPADLSAKIFYTGYVAAPFPAVEAAPTGEVLVAVGGGDLGRPLLAAAAEAATLSPLPWRLLVGGADAAEHAASLGSRWSAPNLTVEPARPDYRDHLARAACSISLCGYNTFLDLAAVATPAIVVPDATGGEREQTIRASVLRTRPGFAVLTPAEASPERLAAEAAALAGKRRPPLPISRDGAARSAALILDLARPSTARKAAP